MRTNNVNDLVELVSKILSDGKGQDIQVIDLKNKSSIANFMIIASGNAPRHVSALSDRILKELKANDINVLIEGTKEGKWVLLDLGNIIVHIFEPETREFYSLEKLWSEPMLFS